ncbi:MAG: hypothetical protein R2823_10330 [Acidimicrobiia bacterium]
MEPVVPPELLALAESWKDLHRWERKQLGLSLRRLGLTFSEIQTLIAVPKSTLSNWCREVTMTNAQIEAIRDRTGPHTQRGIPRDTQRKRHIEIASIRRDAYKSGYTYLNDARWVGGVVLYWAEGSKTRNMLDLANSDPAALRYFIRWVRRYLDEKADFKLGLHLHAGNDESAAKRYWSTELGMEAAPFGKTFIKPAGTGHRKNPLPHGVCRVRTRKASNYWHQVMVWIDVVAEAHASLDRPPW